MLSAARSILLCSLVIAGVLVTPSAVLAQDVGAVAASPQDWTAMALLAALVLGIGSQMVVAVKKQTEAVTALTTEIRLMSERERDSSRAHCALAEKLLEKLERLPHEVAALMERKNSP